MYQPEHGGFYALRFRVLSRDNFTCQYCGAFAPNVVLQVDHRIPVAAGGTDDLENLVTACTACNLGKGDLLRMHLLAEPYESHTPTDDPAVALRRALATGARSTEELADVCRRSARWVTYQARRAADIVELHAGGGRGHRTMWALSESSQSGN